MGVPFECDLCQFVNMNHRYPVPGDPLDDLTLVAIRRALLDAAWAREPSTVQANLSRARRDHSDAMSRCSIERDELPYLPNHSLEDRVGMRYAVQVLHTSLRPGVYAENIQFETLRKTETWVSNMHDAGAAYSTARARDGDARDNDYRSTSPTRGRWFRRFMRGVKLRMGQIRYQNEPLTPGIILGLDAIITAEWMNTTDQAHKEKLEELMCFILIGFGCSLRGEEVPLVSLRGLNKFWDETWAADDPYIMITLYGRFKGETGFRWHCLPISDLSRSRLPFRKWISTLLQRRVEIQGRSKGWLFVKKDGRTRAQIRDYDALFLQYLELLRDRQPELFSEGTLMYMFSLRRSMRRGAVLATTGRARLHRGGQPRQQVEDEGGRERLCSRPFDGADVHEHAGRHSHHDQLLEGAVRMRLPLLNLGYSPTEGESFTRTF